MRRKIYYNLAQSVYKQTIAGYVFYFSSELHWIKFVRRYEDFHDSVMARLNRSFKVECDLPVFTAVSLYNTIETRGYLIQLPGGDRITCREQARLSGGRLTKKS